MAGAALEAADRAAGRVARRAAGRVTDRGTGASVAQGVLGAYGVPATSATPATSGDAPSGEPTLGELIEALSRGRRAQAAAVAKADPAVDTVFEIGGQDSKFISLEAGQVADFQMNKICAAGTGSFVEEQAARMGFAGTAFKGWDLSGEGAAAHAVDGRVVAANRAFYARSRELFLAGYTPERDPGKKTVGIPRALLMHRLFPMANAFFRELGFNTHLTPESADDTIRAAQATCRGETCYPVKLVHGHMAQLAEAGVDYVFMPRVRTMRHEGSRVRHNYACVYMQAAPLIAAKALHFEERGIRLISPMLDMELGQAEMASAMLGVGAELGFTPERTAQAMLAGGFALTEYGSRVEALGDELLASLAPGERVLVIVTRNYGISDPVLNMGIPEILLERGVKVITMGHLHGHDVDVSDAYPDMCWPFGQHILGSARIIREDPRLFAVYLTNHGCGPDTMLSHLFAEEMAGKPYLQIEVDEHFSKVGVVTRVEAFLNALDHWDVGGEKGLPSAPGAPGNLELGEKGLPPALGATGNLELDARLRPEAPVALPDCGPHARQVARWLGGRGLDVRLVPADARALGAGRAEATTKEYLTFTMALGQALVAAEDLPGAQVVVPRTAGAEADGQYARVIAGVLTKRGVDALVVAPRLETLAWELDDVDGLFEAVLAGDAELARAGVRAAPGPSAPGEGAFSPDDRAFSPDDRASSSVASASAPKSIALVGEWELVANDVLTGGLFERVAAGAVRVRRMPLAEYLWFLWNDDLTSERDELERRDGDDGADDGAPGPSPAELDRRQAILDRLAAKMRAASDELGPASAFSPDLAALVRVADGGMGRFAGGGGRYRWAKAVELGREADGVVTVSSMYENTETILQLLGGRDGVPQLSLAFDGSPGQGAEERLRSFLYYL